MIKSVIFASVVLSIVVVRSKALNDGDVALGSVNRVTKDAEKVMPSDIQSAKNKTVEPKAASRGTYAPASFLPTAYSQFAQPSAYQIPATVPYYPIAAAASYYPAAAGSAVSYYDHVASPYNLPLAATVPQPSIISSYSSYLYRDQERAKESKVPVDGKTLPYYLRTSAPYAPSYYQTQPLLYSIPVSDYQYDESLPAVAAVQPITYTAPQYDGYTYNRYRSQNIGKKYSIPTPAPIARDASSNNDNVYDSLVPIAYSGYLNQIEDLRQQNSQQYRPSYQFESLPLSRIANEPSFGDYEPWSYDASIAGSAGSSPIPLPAANDQEYIAMNLYDFNRNARSKAANYYTSLYPNANQMGWSAVTTPTAPITTVNALPTTAFPSPLPPFAYSGIVAQMNPFWNAMYKQNLETENQRLSDSKASDDEKKSDVNRLFSEMMKILKSAPKSNESKEADKEKQDDAKKSDDKSGKKKLEVASI